MSDEPKTRPGVQYVCESKPGDKLMQVNGKILIINKDYAPKIVEDGVVRELNFSEIDAELSKLHGFKEGRIIINGKRVYPT